MKEEISQFNTSKRVFFKVNLKEGIELDESGQYDPNKVAQLEAIKEKLRKTKANETSLETNIVFASEYETPAPVKTIQKRTKFAGKRRKIEKADIEDFLDKEGDNIESGPKSMNDIRMKQLEENNESEIADQVKQSVKYGNAIKKAKKLNLEMLNAKDEYDEIQEALDKQRRQAIKNVKLGEELAQEIISQSGPNEIEDKKEPDEDVISTNTLSFIKAIPSIKEQR